jgi:hypothetical protein
MAIISRNAGRGAALANAVEAVNRVRTGTVSKTASQPAVATPTGSVVAAVQQAVARQQAAATISRPKSVAVAPRPTPTGSLIAAAQQQAAANVIAQNLRQRIETPAPVAAAYKFMPSLSPGYENIENTRAAARYTVQNPPPPAGPSKSALLQQQMQDYDMMRAQAGLPPTQVGGYGDQYTIPAGTRVVSSLQKEPKHASPPGTYEPLDIGESQALSPTALGMAENPHASLLPQPAGDLPSLYTLTPEDIDSRRSGPSAIRPRPRGMTVPGPSRPEPSVDDQVAAVRAQIMQILGGPREGNPLHETDVDTLVQLYAQEQELAKRQGGSDIGNAITSVLNYDVQDEIFSPYIQEPASEALQEFLASDNKLTDVVNLAIDTLQRPTNWHMRNTGAVLTAIALGGDDFVPGGDLVQDLMDALGVRDKIIEAANNGYTGPGGTHFEGPRAPVEMLIGYCDDLPGPLAEACKVGTSIALDPLTLAGPVGAAGGRAAMIGRAIAMLDDAGRATRMTGRTIQAAGRGVNLAARGIDEAVALPFRGARAAWLRAGRETPSAFQKSPGQQSLDARTDLESFEVASRAARDQAEQSVNPTNPSAASMVPSSQEQPSLVSVVDDVDGPTKGTPVVRKTVGEQADNQQPLLESQFAEDTRTRGGEFPDQQTGELIATPSNVTPGSTPRLARIIERAQEPGPVRVQNLNNPQLPEENLYSPVAGRDTLIDDPVNVATATNDPVTIQQAEAFYDTVEPLVATQLATDDWYRRWGSADSLEVGIVTEMSPEVQARLTAAFPNSQNAFTARNAMVKEAAEFVAMLESEAYHVAAAMRNYGFEVDPRIRTSRANAGGSGLLARASWRTERFQYLAERFVKTTDPEEAQAILDVLSRSNGATIQFPNGKRPYLAGVPSTLKDDILIRLREARTAFQDALTASDETIQRVVDNNVIPPRTVPDPAAQIGGGLGQQSRQAAATIRKIADEQLHRSRKQLVVDGKAAGLSLRDLNDVARQTFGVPVTKLTQTQVDQLRTALRLVDSEAIRNAPVAGALDSGLPEAQVADVVEEVVPAATKKAGLIQRIRDAAVEAADMAPAAGIRHVELRGLNQEGLLSNADTAYGDTVIEWRPPNRKPVTNLDGTPETWTVQDALDDIRERQGIATTQARASGKKGRDLQEALDEIQRGVDGELQMVANLAADLPADLGKAGATRAAKVLRAYDRTMSVNRQMRLYGPITGVQGFVGDWFGNVWAPIVNGDFATAARVANPVRVFQEWRSYRGQSRSLRQALESSDSDMLRETGQVYPIELMPGFTTGELPVSGLPSINEAAAGNVVTRTAANLAAVPAIKDGRVAVDFLGRKGAFDQGYSAYLRDTGLPSFTKRIRMEAGADAQLWIDRIHAEARIKAGGRKWNGMFSPEDVREGLRGVTKKNTDLSRAWQNQLKTASEQGLLASKRIYFDYKNLNIDEAARRAFTFHYWQSRAYPMYARTAMRNPVLINMYYNLWDYVRDKAQEDNLPPFINDMLRFVSGPNGLYGMFNPIGFLLPTTILDMYSEKGESWSVVRNQLSMYIGAAMAMSGFSDQPPNIIPSRATEQWVQNLANWLESQGHVPEQIPLLGDILNDGQMYLPGAWSTQITNRIFDKANELFSEYAWTAGDYEPFNREANETDQIRTYVQQIVTELYGPRYTVDPNNPADIVALWTPEQMAAYQDALNAVTSGANGNAIAEEAQQRWATEGLYQDIFMFVPAGTVWRSTFRDQQMELADQYYANGFKGDAAQTAAAAFRGEAKATDPAWVVANQQYHDIGTEEQQGWVSLYNDLINNPDELATASGGALLQLEGYERWDPAQWIDYSILMNMDEDQRREYVDKWFAQAGILDDVQQVQQQKQDFKTANPGYEQYATYQGGVLNYDGGASAFRQDMAANPNFKRAEDQKREELKAQGYSGAVLEAELDQWASTQQAYHAAMGMQYQLDDPSPISVNDQSKNPLGIPAMSFMLPDEEGSGSGSGTSSSDPEEDRQKKVWRDYDSPEAQEQKWQQVQDREGWANYTAEMMYGDAWNEETGKWEEWAYDDKGYRQSVTGNEAGNTGYYMTPSDDSPPKWGTAPNDNRFEEWRQYMIRTNPNVAQHELTIEAWAAWELGIFNEYLASVRPQAANPPPGAWSRWLEEGIDWNAA